MLACYAVTDNAVARVRAGGGPVLIEALTYRMGPHTTSDDPTRYRDPAELARWADRDPIERYRRYLERIGVWTPRLAERAETHAHRLSAEAREAIVGAPDPDPGELFDAVYHDITPELAAQRDQLRTELAREAGQ